MHAEGEALTNGEVMELLRNQKKEKKAKTQKKEGRSRNLSQPSHLKPVPTTLTTVLIKCGGVYLDT